MKQDESYKSLILDNEHAPCTPKITVREQQILQLCAKGMTTAEIARTLHRASTFTSSTSEQSLEHGAVTPLF